MCKSKKNEDNYNILNKEITLILIIHNLMSWSVSNYGKMLITSHKYMTKIYILLIVM